MRSIGLIALVLLVSGCPDADAPASAPASGFVSQVDGGTTVLVPDYTVLQHRVSGACSGGAVQAINADGTVTCSGALLTGVTAGAGLTGGGTSGNVGVAVAFGGTGSATTVSRSDHTHFANTLVVSALGTPTANGTALFNAVNALTPTAAAPWLVKVEPGIYDLGTNSLVLKPFTDLEGSGEDVTQIKSAGSASVVGTLGLQGISQVRRVRVTNYGGAAYAIAIVNAPPTGTQGGTLDHVTAEASGSAFNIGVDSVEAARFQATDVHVVVSSTGTQTGFGVNDVDGTARYRTVDVEVSGGATATGFNFSSLNFQGQLDGVHVDVSGATTNTAVNTSGFAFVGTLAIRNSTLNSTGNWLVSDSFSEVLVATSQLVGTHSSVISPLCTLTYNASFAPSGCP